MTSSEPLPERIIALTASVYATEHSETADARSWFDLFAAVQRVVPGAVQFEPGFCAMRARGPARYYGGEDAAARRILAAVAEVVDARVLESISIGVANGVFAARLAAETTAHHPGLRALSPNTRIVASEDTVRFLALFPVDTAADEQLAETLSGLGAHTLGAFAAFPEHLVLQRFGRGALTAHRRARGLGEPHTEEVPAGSPVRDFSMGLDFEPALSGDDQLAFACSDLAERFVQNLSTAGLVCTELRIDLHDDTGAVHERTWSHPANFTPADVVNRARWQAAALTARPASTQVPPSEQERGGAGITAVRFCPARTARAAEHEPGLWNTAPDERVHHQLTRVQGMVGHEQVATGALLGGRLSADRQRAVPWGNALTADVSRPRDGPWPGKLTGALPTLVFSAPPRVELIGADETPVVIDADELLSADPERFRAAGRGQTVRAWSAPWHVREQWWRHEASALCAHYRMQVVLEDGEAWLLRFTTSSGWSAEGKYA